MFEAGRTSPSIEDDERLNNRDRVDACLRATRAQALASVRVVYGQRRHQRRRPPRLRRPCWPPRGQPRVTRRPAGSCRRPSGTSGRPGRELLPRSTCGHTSSYVVGPAPILDHVPFGYPPVAIAALEAIDVPEPDPEITRPGVAGQPVEPHRVRLTAACVGERNVIVDEQRKCEPASCARRRSKTSVNVMRGSPMLLP